jgi:AAA ATPase domain
MAEKALTNPFRPGAGHMPPYLAGRDNEKTQFSQILKQSPVLENIVLTGLRGVGKTVLADTFRPMAIGSGWLWVGTDLSESASISEESLALRLLTDLAVATSSLTIQDRDVRRQIGFTSGDEDAHRPLTFDFLAKVYGAVPGLVVDKIKAVLAIVNESLKSRPNISGIIFAYDEAQNLADHADTKQYPLSVLLDTFQSIQKAGFPFLLLLVGLPTLFPKLVDARTFAERMFHIMFLHRLGRDDSRAAITRPLRDLNQEDVLSPDSVETIIAMSGGYPFFIQFICREVYDVFVQQKRAGQQLAVPREEVIRKLDTNFFAGRWGLVTDRQREMLAIIARLPTSSEEFTIQEVVSESKNGPGKPFSPSHANRMLALLAERGLVYKGRHGKYCFAVPLMDQFIVRQMTQPVLEDDKGQRLLRF